MLDKLGLLENGNERVACAQQKNATTKSNQPNLFVFQNIEKLAGTIITDGDRKFWDPRAPLIWDNFSIDRTNCAILTSYIRTDPRTCRGYVLARKLSRCPIEIIVRVARFSCRLFTVMAGNRQGIDPGLLYVVLYPMIMEKVNFSGSKARLQFRALNE